MPAPKADALVKSVQRLVAEKEAIAARRGSWLFVSVRPW